MELCACGCGETIQSGKFRRGHHQRGVGGFAELPPDEKTCGFCGKKYVRGTGKKRQSNKHWASRQFCTEECRRASRRVDISSPTKRCSVCGQEKRRHEDFWKHKGSPDGRRNACKACAPGLRRVTPVQARKYNLRALYGVTPDQYHQMWAAQGGVCAICGRRESAINHRNGQAYPLAVDHCHETAEVRGLLCRACNNGIGQLRHDPEILSAAISYLGRAPLMGNT